MSIKTVAASLLLVGAATIFGCGDNPSAQTNANGPVANTTAAKLKAPFDYKSIKATKSMSKWGPQVDVELQTTNEVAKKATRDDLRQLLEYMVQSPEPCRAFIELRTPVIGADPWGSIRRYEMNGKWIVDIDKYHDGIDALPYYFMDRIDRSVENQAAMILTLPVVNRIVEKVSRRGWNVKQRDADFVLAESPFGTTSADVRMTPEQLTFHTFQMGEVEFIDTCEELADEWAIGNQVKAKLQSVIGSPKYVEATGDGAADWEWTIGQLNVTYSHFGQQDEFRLEYRYE